MARGQVNQDSNPTHLLRSTFLRCSTLLSRRGLLRSRSTLLCTRRQLARRGLLRARRVLLCYRCRLGNSSAAGLRRCGRRRGGMCCIDLGFGDGPRDIGFLRSAGLGGRRFFGGCRFLGGWGCVLVTCGEASVSER
jgi:hypothetical protein